MVVLYLLAMWGLSLLIRNASGPFDWLDKIRIYLLQNNIIGPFIYGLLSCSLCIGFHCGWIIYLMAGDGFSMGRFLVWGCCGSGIVYLMEKIDTKFGS